jgi:predicted dehydrogenase
MAVKPHTSRNLNKQGVVSQGQKHVAEEPAHKFKLIKSGKTRVEASKLLRWLIVRVEAAYAAALRKLNIDPTGYGCCFATDTGNHDSGSALVTYDTGIHVVYTQNFVARNRAAKRGARFIGYDGTVEFDFPTAKITVYEHHTGKVEVIDMSGDFGQHFGGDRRLAEAFLDVLKGKPSRSTLAEGILSVSMCLAARESAESRRFVDVDFAI